RGRQADRSGESPAVLRRRPPLRTVFATTLSAARPAGDGSWGDRRGILGATASQPGDSNEFRPPSRAVLSRSRDAVGGAAHGGPVGEEARRPARGGGGAGVPADDDAADQLREPPAGGAGAGLRRVRVLFGAGLPRQRGGDAGDAGEGGAGAPP